MFNCTHTTALVREKNHTDDTYVGLNLNIDNSDNVL